MEQKNLKVCYEGSGIKSLRGWSIFWTVIASIGGIVFLIGAVLMLDNSALGGYLLITGLSTAFTGCALAPVFRGLATVAETALIQKHIIMNEYKIVETEESIRNNAGGLTKNQKGSGLFDKLVKLPDED